MSEAINITDARNDPSTNIITVGDCYADIVYNLINTQNHVTKHFKYSYGPDKLLIDPTRQVDAVRCSVSKKDLAKWKHMFKIAKIRYQLVGLKINITTKVILGGPVMADEPLYNRIILGKRVIPSQNERTFSLCILTDPYDMKINLLPSEYNLLYNLLLHNVKRYIVEPSAKIDINWFIPMNPNMKIQLDDDVHDNLLKCLNFIKVENFECAICALPCTYKLINNSECCYICDIEKTNYTKKLHGLALMKTDNRLLIKLNKFDYLERNITNKFVNTVVTYDDWDDLVKNSIDFNKYDEIIFCAKVKPYDKLDIPHYVHKFMRKFISSTRASPISIRIIYHF